MTVSIDNEDTLTLLRSLAKIRRIGVDSLVREIFATAVTLETALMRSKQTRRIVDFVQCEADRGFVDAILECEERMNEIVCHHFGEGREAEAEQLSNLLAAAFGASKVARLKQKR